MSNYVNRARSEYTSVSSIIAASRQYKGARENFHCALVGAVILAITTGQATALTRLYEESGMFGPKVRTKDGKRELFTLNADGRLIASYINDGLMLGRDGDLLDPVLRLDRESGKWLMGGDRVNDPKWSSALEQRDFDSILDLMEIPFWMHGKAPKVAKESVNVNDAVNALLKRLMKADSNGLALDVDVEKLRDQVERLANLVNNNKAKKASQHHTATIYGLPAPEKKAA